MKIRRQARVVALQTLFEVDSVNHPAELVLAQRLEAKPLPAEGRAFAKQLVLGVLKHQQDLDEIIQSIATDWPLEQMAIVDRNILRIAVYEITVDGQTPVKVAINEAVELAKLFGSDSSRRFVNGVLGTLVSNRGVVSKE
ncbi:MAG: transcription antitermination factor NusB [Anaerolineae bacterium]